MGAYRTHPGGRSGATSRNLSDGVELEREKMLDSFGRRMETLRISVTDRCNFRCRYCMPPEGLAWLPHHSHLSNEKIVTVAQAFLKLGGSKLRITGGEPLLRGDLPELIKALVLLPELHSLGVTTNGSLLLQQVESLWDAGLRRLNISLDSLNPCKFEWICLSDRFAQVWQGLHRALQIGFLVKINTVVLKGITEQEVNDLVALAVAHDIEVRFIEFMPLCGTGWRPELCFPIQTVRQWVEKKFQLTPMVRGSAPAESFQIEGGRGRVGFIASLSDPFCGKCSRIRLSADGTIYPCLFSKIGLNLVPYLDDAEKLQEQLRAVVWRKPKGHDVQSLNEWQGEELPNIRSIGG